MHETDGMPDGRTSIDELLLTNQSLVGSHPLATEAIPSRHLAVLTCMDTRIDLSLLGITPGQAHILRNGGGRVTDDVLRSLAVSVHLLGVTDLVVMQHTRCGLLGVTNEVLRQRTGAALDFLPIADHRPALEADLQLVAGAPFLSGLTTVVGLLYDVGTGEVTEVLRHTS